MAMVPTVKPALDPLAQRAAIDALEAQRAAYRRYARAVEGQSHAVASGDGDQATAAADAAARGADELDAGTRALRPHLERVRDTGSAEQQAEVQRRIELLSHNAERAQVAIQNLTAQLDAWRSAYGHQLAAVGLTPGGIGGADGSAADAGAAGAPAGGGGSGGTKNGRAYGPRGQLRVGRSVPSLLDRKG